MWYVICGTNDQPALWAYEGLKAAGLEPLELVNAEVLGSALSWDHRLENSGTGIEVKLPDGRTIRGKETRGVLNRLLMMFPPHLQAADPGDREYAIQEFSAFYCSWLYCLPGPVLNRPTPQGLSGQWRHISEWVYLAGQAGLPTAVYRKSSGDEVTDPVLETRLVPYDTPVTTVFVLDGEVIGSSLPGEIRDGCRKLHELSGTGLLGIEFTHPTGTPWQFVGATSSPDLRLGGQPLLDCLKYIFERKQGERQ